MTNFAHLLREHKEGVLIGVRVTPKSSTNEIAGLFRASDGAVSLQVRVTAQPEKGKANKAVIKVLAKELGFAKSNLEIVAGDAARYKSVLVRVPREDVAKALAKLLPVQ